MPPLIAPLVLEELTKKFPKEYKDDLIMLYSVTYTYGYQAGQRDQRLSCDCAPDEDDN